MPSRHRLLSRCLAVLLTTLVTAGALTTVPATASQSPKTTRITGINRYATSANAVNSAYTAGSNHAVLVSGENRDLAVAFAGIALAGSVGGPLILTHPTRLLGSTGNALSTVDSGLSGTMTIHIVGDTTQVSAGIEAQLVDLGYLVERTSGASDLATILAAAEKTHAWSGIGSYDGGRAVVIAGDSSLVDAVPILGLAHSSRFPVITVGDTLDAATTEFLDREDLEITQAIIVGSTTVVSAAVADSLAAITNGSTPIEVTRLAAVNRYGTATQIADFIQRNTVLDGMGQTTTNAIVTSGTSAVDGLSAAMLASNGVAAVTEGSFPAVAGTSSVILLHVGNYRLHSTARTYLQKKASDYSTGVVVGGPTAIPRVVLDGVKTAITRSTPTVTASPREGSPTVSIRFSTKMACTSSTTGGGGAGAGLASNYKLNNAALAGNAYVTCASNKRSATLRLGTVASGGPGTFAEGDVLAVEALTSTEQPDLDGEGLVTTTTVKTWFSITGTTFNSGKAYVGSTNAWITFNSARAITASDLAIVDAGNAANVVVSVTQKGGSNTWTVLTTDAFTNDDTLTVNAPRANSGTVRPEYDALKPTISSAVLSTYTTTGATATMTSGTGQFKIVSKAAGSVPGVLGERWSAEVMDGTNTSAVMINTADRTVTISTPIAKTELRHTASALVTMLNADSTFSADFTASVTTPGIVDSAHALTMLSGGQTTYSVAVTMSEAMLGTTWAAHGTPIMSVDALADMVTDVGSTGTAQDHDWLAGTATYRVVVTEAASALLAGRDTIMIDMTASDVKGNAPTTSYKVVMTAD